MLEWLKTGNVIHNSRFQNCLYIKKLHYSNNWVISKFYTFRFIKLIMLICFIFWELTYDLVWKEKAFCYSKNNWTSDDLRGFGVGLGLCWRVSQAPLKAVWIWYLGADKIHVCLVWATCSCKQMSILYIRIDWAPLWQGDMLVTEGVSKEERHSYLSSRYLQSGGRYRG